MEVVNVKVKFIRPKYDNLVEWMEDPTNHYIGRRGVVFVVGEDGNKRRFPERDSEWANPFKVGKDGTRDQVVEKYRKYILQKIQEDPKTFDLNELVGKRLGCWCAPDLCHGHVLKKLVLIYRIKERIGLLKKMRPEGYEERINRLEERLVNLDL